MAVKNKKPRKPAVLVQGHAPEASPSGPADRLPFWLPVLIFLLAMAIRLIFLLEVSASPFFNFRGLDADHYHQYAVGFASGTWPDSSPFFWPPLYSLFLSSLYPLVGQAPMAIKIVQAILGSGTCVLVLLIGRMVFAGRFVAVTAALTCCLYGTLVFFDAQLLPGSLDVFLSVLAVYLVLLAGRRQRVGWWVLAGGTIGLSVINRGWILLFLPVAIGWAWQAWRTLPSTQAQGKVSPARWPRVLALLMPVALLTCPVTWHNVKHDIPYTATTALKQQGRPFGQTLKSFLGGGFAYLTYNTGINFCLGNRWDLHDRINVDHPDCLPTYDRLMSEPLNKGALTGAEQSSYLMHETLRIIRQHPLDWLKALGWKTLQAVNGGEIARNVSIYADRQYSVLLTGLLWKHLVAFPGGLLIPLALVGLFLVRRHWREHWLLWGYLAAQLVFVVAFFVIARYRLPMVPLLSLYAAYAVQELIDLGRQGDSRRLAQTLAALGGLLVVCNLGIGPMERDHRAFEYSALGDDQEPTQRDKAMAYYDRAIQIQPTFAATWNQSGMLLLQTRRMGEAIQRFQRALELRPDYPQAHSNLAGVLVSLGRWPEAIEHFRQSLPAAGNRMEVFNNAALALASCPVADLRDGPEAVPHRREDVQPERLQQAGVRRYAGCCLRGDRQV